MASRSKFFAIRPSYDEIGTEAEHFDYDIEALGESISAESSGDDDSTSTTGFARQWQSLASLGIRAPRRSFLGSGKSFSYSSYQNWLWLRYIQIEV